MKSIRARMMAIVLSLFLLAWGVMAIWTWGAAEHEIEEVFDAQLAQASVVLLDLTRAQLDDADGLRDFQADTLGLSPVHRYEKKIAFQVWKNGQLWLRSASAPTAPMTRAPGYSDGELNGERWRFLSRNIDGGRVQIMVGERYVVRDEMIHNLNKQTVVPMLVTLPLLGVLVAWGIRQGLAPLARLTRQIRNRSSLDLQPVALREVPTEITDLVVALNSLLSRLQQAFQAERRFTADAAHELRTPLSVVRTQAQLAQRAQDVPARTEALQGVVDGVDRANRLVNQLLTLARVDSTPLLQGASALDLSEVVETEIRNLSAMPNRDTAPPIHLQLQPAPVRGLRDLLSVLVRNVVQNALQYAEDANEIRVQVAPCEHGVCLTVEDDGPGIPEAQLESVQERFVRLEGNEAEGSGLGLSIVRRIAELHDAQFDLSNVQPHGLRVTLRFPPLQTA